MISKVQSVIFTNAMESYPICYNLNLGVNWGNNNPQRSEHHQDIYFLNIQNKRQHITLKAQ